MKVLLFTPQLVGGGAQQVAILLAAGLLARGHDVHLTAAKLSGPLLRRVPQECHLTELGVDRPIQGSKPLARLVNQIEPDAVICFGIFTGIAAAISSLRWRHRPVLVIRNENHLASDWNHSSALNRVIGPVLSRWAVRNATVVAVSQALSRDTANFLKLPHSRVKTILNPVFDDTAPASETSASVHEWLQHSSQPTFVAIGRLEHQKGFDLLIDAFAAVRKHHVARLLVFGEGTLRQQLQRQIDELGLTHDIELAGHTDNPIGQMRASHAFVLSSRYEGFGLVLVEALWAGARIISTDCNCGPAELLEHGTYGTLVPPNDARALAAAMLDSLTTGQRQRRPSEIWFKQFTATAAADHHLAAIKSAAPIDRVYLRR